MPDGCEIAGNAGGGIADRKGGIRLQKKNKGIQAALWVLFLVYLVIMAYLLFFSSAYGRTIEAGYRYNLTPLLEIMRGIENIDSVGYRYVIINIGGNVVAFMPFGFLVSCLAGRRQNVFTIFLKTLLFSFIIEVIQYFSRTGAFDVDDLILNTLGGILGYFCYLYFTRRRRRSR